MFEMNFIQQITITWNKKFTITTDKNQDEILFFPFQLRMKRIAQVIILQNNK